MTKKTFFVMGLAVVFGVLCLAGSANANIAGVTVDSFYSENPATGRYAASLSNGSGLTGGLHDNNPFNMWMNSDATAVSQASVNAQWLIFDLGGTYDLTSSHIWNYNEVTAWADPVTYPTYYPFWAQRRGVYEMEVSVSADKTTWTSLGLKYLTAANGQADPGQDVALTAAGVRYVKFDINKNQTWSGVWTSDGSPPNPDTDYYVGLSEVQFTGTPEPATMLLLGLGSLILRRRKSC